MDNKNNSTASVSGLAVFENTEFTIDRQLREKPGNAHSYHYHDSYEIYYLFSGDRFYFINDKTYHAKHGSLVLINPYEIHCASKFSEEPYERILISFKKSFLSELSCAFKDVNFFKSFEEEIHIIDVPLSERAFLEALLNSMLSEYKKDMDASKCFLKTAICQDLMHIWEFRAQLSEDAGLDISVSTLSALVISLSRIPLHSETPLSISEAITVRSGAVTLP